MKRLLAAACLLLGPSAAFADNWGFPLQLSDANTTIRFEVDSTWHLVEGKTNGIRGSLALAEADRAESVRGEIVLPVGKFDTDSSRRDTRMREVMAADKFPDVRYEVQSAETVCSAQALAEATPCKLSLHGLLTIRGVVRPWEIAGELVRTGRQFRLRGSGSLRWRDFGVEDPSIFVAKLRPDVLVNIDVVWNN